MKDHLDREEKKRPAAHHIMSSSNRTSLSEDVWLSVKASLLYLHNVIRLCCVTLSPSCFLQSQNPSQATLCGIEFELSVLISQNDWTLLSATLEKKKRKKDTPAMDKKCIF